MINDREFAKMLETLSEFGLNDGDRGYIFFSKVIEELKEMRAELETYNE